MGNGNIKCPRQNTNSEVKIKIKQTEILRWLYIPTGTINVYFHIIKKNILYSIELRNQLIPIIFEKMDQHTGGQVVNPRPQTLQEQPVRKPETPLQEYPYSDVNTIQRSSKAANQFRCFQRRSEVRNILGRCVIAGTSVSYIYSVSINSNKVQANGEIKANIPYRTTCARKGQGHRRPPLLIS